MSDKYIIKNCPTLMGNRLCYGKTIKQCADCTDCIMKQIVEKCKDKIRIYEYYDKDYALGKVTCAKSILHLFDIQEIE